MEGESYPDPNSASAFTAVNAQRSPAAMNSAKATNGHENRGPIEGEPHERPNSQAARRPASPMPDRPPNGRTSSTQQAHPSPPSPIKRKRSYPEPEEDHRTGPYHAQPQPYPILHQQDHNRPSSRTDGPPTNGRGGNSEKHPAHDEPHAYPPPSRLQDYDADPSHLNGHYDPPMPGNQPYYTQGPDNADVRMAEALQRETHSSHPPPRHVEYGGHESEEHQDEKSYQGHHDMYEHHEQYSGHPNDHNRTPVSGPDGDRKRRKRVFSNRTKTGCMTCRKRKKKCDETHPECNNCVRGGFVCEGYTIRNTWQKPMPTKMPAPLMSKDGYGEPSRPPHRYSNEVSPEYADSPSQGRHPMGDGDRSKPIVVDEGREHMHGITSPSSSSRGPPQSWTKPPRGSYGGSSAPPKYYPGYDRPGSAHGSHPDYPPHDVGDVSMRPPTTHRTHNGPPAASPAAGPHAAPAAVAQAALQQASPPTRPTPPPPSSRSSHHRLSLSQMTEREKMLRGEYYLPYTPALMADRDRCAAAVWHFNNSMNPTTGISSEERLRFFKAILSLRPSQEPTPEGTARPPTDNFDPPVGSVGPGVIVEAPFHCDYGYNIKIGQDVIIGPDCRISDTCSVTIGSNVVFSPGVKLICANYAVDPRDRRRGKGRQMGRAIIIEDDCWIGAGAMIMPGVRVGRSSTVAAGAVISKEVPPYTVTAGNPQKVVRGIYDDHSRD